MGLDRGSFLMKLGGRGEREMGTGVDSHKDFRRKRSLRNPARGGEGAGAQGADLRN